MWEEPVLYGQFFEEVYKQSRKGRVHDAVREGLKPRPHKDLKDLKLHGLEQERPGNVISILGALKGYHW